MYRLSTLLVGMLIFVIGSGAVTAAEIVVETGGSIQTAVSSASPGDTIIVKPGTYTENIRIVTPDLVIRSESGNPEDTVITARDLRTNVLSLEQANNTQISGFKITGSGDSYSAVYLIRCSNCTISNNDLSDNYQGVFLRYSDYNRILNNVVFGRYKGIYLQDSNYNTLSGNRANSSNQYGVHLLRSQRNTLSNNIANSSTYDGIVLENADYNNLTGNVVSSNGRYGFYLMNSSNCGLNGNTASSNSRGIYLIRSNSTTISGNQVSENNAYGILTSYSNYNTISGNTANKTFRGIHLDSSDGNTVSGNTAASDSVSGLFMCQGSDSNRVFDNYLNNTYNADIRNTRNTWNTTRKAGTNIVGGNYIGGNFWANPSGTGFSQTAQDANRDGIADTEYIGTNFTDYLPLVPVSGQQQPVLPIANFTSNITSGNAPLVVQFTDTSQYATGRNWDFENDGTVGSNVQNPIHVYAIAGTYTVKLIAVNVNGTASKTATIIVSEQSKPVVPAANFSANTTQGYAPLSVQFTDTSQYATGRNWDFENDGIIDSNVQNPVHMYTAAGSYTVNLTAVNTNGTGSRSMVITVYNPAQPVPPVVDFTSNVTSGYTPLAVQFTSLSNGAMSLSWDFDNDGNTDSNLPAPVHVYEVPGAYTVKLTAGNQNGTSSKTAIINVLEEGNVNKIFPVADFSMNVSKDYAPLSVLFTDLSQNATEIGWDFNNDGKVEVNQSPVVYVYTAPGEYTVTLIAANGNGTDSKTATITVLKENNSKGGSGGGGGGSPEPAKNVEVKELSQVFITNGKTVKFDFKRNATCVVYVSFDAKKTAGKITTTVEQLKNRSALVPALPEGETYKSFNVWVGNSGFATPQNIENPVVCFRVEKTWIENKMIEQDSITLNRYNNKSWEQTRATLTGEDSRYLYFTSGVSGYSFFAINGTTKPLSEESATTIEPEQEIQSIEGVLESTGSEVENEPSQGERVKVPGFEMVYGIACLIAVFLYLRR